MADHTVPTGSPSARDGSAPRDEAELPPLWAEIMGSGPLVVLLHGLADTHGLWQFVAPQLARRYRVAAVDHYAHGRSPMPRGELTTEKMADAVADLIEREGGGQPAVVIGLSMGGGVAQVLALRRPELVRALGLVSTSSEFKPDNKARFLDRAAKAEREGMAAVIEETVPRWFTPEWPAAQPKAYEQVVQTVLANPPERFAAASRANAERGWSDRLGEIRCPVLFVGGEHDPMGIHRVAGIYREHLPQARIEIVPGASHLIPIQKPDELNAILLDWLGELGD